MNYFKISKNWAAMNFYVLTGVYFLFLFGVIFTMELKDELLC